MKICDCIGLIIFASTLLSSCTFDSSSGTTAYAARVVPSPSKHNQAHDDDSALYHQAENLDSVARTPDHASHDPEHQGPHRITAGAQAANSTAGTASNTAPSHPWSKVTNSTANLTSNPLAGHVSAILKILADPQPDASREAGKDGQTADTAEQRGEPTAAEAEQQGKQTAGEAEQWGEQTQSTASGRQGTVSDLNRELLGVMNKDNAIKLEMYRYTAKPVPQKRATAASILAAVYKTTAFQPAAVNPSTIKAASVEVVVHRIIAVQGRALNVSLDSTSRIDLVAWLTAPADIPSNPRPALRPPAPSAAPPPSSAPPFFDALTALLTLAPASLTSAAPRGYLYEFRLPDRTQLYMLGMFPPIKPNCFERKCCKVNYARAVKLNICPATKNKRCSSKFKTRTTVQVSRRCSCTMQGECPVTCSSGCK